MTPEMLYLAELRRELWSEYQREDLWCRTYAVGLYAGISEWHRRTIRTFNPWFRG
jgi:hypothetical protein